MNRLFLMSLAVVATVFVWADPIVLEVSAKQCRPMSSDVLVEYDLFGTGGGCAAIGVSAFDGCRPLPIPPSAIGGEVMPVGDGRHVLTINTSALMTVGGAIANFRVALSATAAEMDPDEVLYKVVDLDSGVITDVTRGEILSGSLGAYSTDYTWATEWIERVPDSKQCLWLEPASNDVFKTSKLVLRKVPAGSFRMGFGDMSDASAGLAVAISRPFYMGVFEMTQAQCEKIAPSLSTAFFVNPSYKNTRPMDSVTFQQIRGKVKGLVWPTDFDRGVDEGTYVDALRKLTKMDGFDLPTEAQWEYACRAGTTTAYNNGYSGSDNDVAAKWVARNKSSATAPATADVDLSGGTLPVGSLCPNPWGLFDMQGNVWEWTLDLYKASTQVGGVDPVGVTEGFVGNNRTVKGGCYSGGNASMQCGVRSNVKVYEVTAGSYGFRVILAD